MSKAVPHPSMILAAYLERFVRGRRVAVFGDATLGLGEKLVERGARLLHAYDADATRAAEAFAKASHDRAHRVTHAALEGDLGVRDGAFDVVVVPDLSIFADPSDVLRKARRLVGQAGLAVVASPNPDASRRLLPPKGAGASPPGYYALYDLVSLQFPSVRMLGQAPFVGYTIADFAAGPDLDVSVDTSLLEKTEEPELFIAIASERKVSVDAFVVVEMALAEVRDALGGGASEVAANDGAAGKLAAAEARLSELNTTLAQHEERRRNDERAAEERSTQAMTTAARIVELEAKLERMRDVDTRAGDTHVRAERLTHQIRDLEEELRRQRDRATKLAKQLDDEKKARTKAEVELGLSRGRNDVPGAKERIEQLTSDLSMVRARALELEQELTAAGSGLEDLASERAELRAKVVELELRLAAREAASKEADPAVLARIAHLESSIERSESTRRAAERRAEEANAALADVTRTRDQLVEKNASLEKRAADLSVELETNETLAADINSLEVQLRERGARVAELERQLREGLRVGKELVEELEAQRAAASASSSGAASSSAPSSPATPGTNGASSPTAYGEAALTDSMKTQLDTLAEQAARSEADLKAAEWRITQLEHALAAAERGEGEPAEVAVELEQALLAAHQELATLRRVAGPEGEHVMPSVVEQSVLLHQLASELDAGGLAQIARPRP